MLGNNENGYIFTFKLKFKHIEERDRQHMGLLTALNRLYNHSASCSPSCLQASAHPAGGGEGQSQQLRRRWQTLFNKGSRWSGALRVAQQTRAGEIQRVHQGNAEVKAVGARVLMSAD